MNDLSENFFTGLLQETKTINIVKQLESLNEFLKNNIQVDNNENDISYNPIYLSNGVAVSPEIAVHCFQDYIRTHRFMLALYRAVQEKLEQFPKRKIKILYAGCGPYCPLILPLLYLFNSTNIEIDVIEINPYSLKSAKQIISFIGKNQYIKKILCIDATQYKPEKEDCFDIIISETMDKALEIEPQVSIFLNLFSYLKKEGILIPEKVTVDLYATDIRKEKSSDYEFYLDTSTTKSNQIQRTFIKNIITLDKSFLKLQHSKKNQENIYLTSLKISDLATENIDLLYITSLKIYKSITLSEDESLLTLKVYALTLTDKIIDSQVEFSYRLNNDPRIIKKIV